MRPHKANATSIPGFISPPKPKKRPIHNLSIPELYEKHAANKRLLSNPYAPHPLVPARSFTKAGVRFAYSAPSTSTFVQHLSAEQAAIEARLTELVGVKEIQEMLRRTSINDSDGMRVDGETSAQVMDDRNTAPTNRTLEAKRRILSKYVSYLLLRLSVG